MNNAIFQAPFQGLRLVDGRVATRSPRTGLPLILSADDAAALAAVPAGWHSDEARPEQGEAGMLSEWTCCTSRPAAARTETETRVSARASTLVIPTKDRPQAVRRILHSLERSPESRPGKVLLLDQSESSEDFRRSDCESAAELVQITRADCEQTAALLASELGVSIAPLLFGLTGGGWGAAYGANLNMGLLLTAGEALAYLDDDMLPVERPGELESAAYRAHGDPTTLTLLPEESSPYNGPVESDRSVLRGHNEFLGMSLQELASQFSVSLRPGVPPAPPIKLLHQAKPGDSYIKGTVHGVIGDCGLWSLHNYVLLSHDCDSPLLSRDEAHYRRHRFSRQVRRASRGLTVTPGGFAMNASMAVDNRSLTIPFMPVFRNMDGVWAQTLLKCDPNGHLAFLPAVVPHLPMSVRPSTQSDHQRASDVRLSDLIMLIVSKLPLPTASLDVEDALRLLGGWMRGIGQMSESSFSRYVRDSVTDILMARTGLLLTAHVDAQLRGATHLMADIRAQLACVERALLQPFAGFADWNGAARWPQCATDVMRLIDNAGEFYRVWPELWSVASKRNAHIAAKG